LEYIMPNPKLRTITAEDIYRFQILSEPRISPDGKHVVYTLQRVDKKTEKKYTNLWITSVENGTPRQFTYGDQNDDSPRWSPDGSQVAFFSNRTDKEKPAQIFLISLAGGEARQLTDFRGEKGDLSWSPDGRRLLCTVRKTDAEVLEREKDEEKRKLGPVDRQYNRVFYKLDGYGYLPNERWHIWTVDARSGKAKQLTSSPAFDEKFPAWAPDGKSIAFISNRSEKPDLRPYADSVFILSTTTGETRQLAAPAGEKLLPSFSLDGKWLAYYGTEGEIETYRNQSVWIVPADGSAPACNLTGPYDVQVSPWTIADMGSPEMMPPTWSGDSQTLYFPVVYHGSSLLKSISVTGEDFQTLIGEGGVVGTFNFDSQQRRLAYLFGKLDDPCQVHLLDLGSGADRVLTTANRDLLKTIDLGQIEEVWFKSPSGMDLQGWVLKPPGFDPSKKYPSILEIHGGPQTQYGNFFMHEFYYLASKGYVVYFSNPRGGRGYGEAHTRAIWQSWGDADYADLMAWTDLVSQLPYIDDSRMGVTGGSYGGYMTNWIIGHTQRFKAAVTQRCVSNLISMWGSSDFNWTFQVELSNKPPFEDLQKFWDHSPMKYIGNARTPTLVIHNEMDLRCPIEQGEQVFVALQTLGVDSEMVRFPEEFHGLSRAGRTDRRIARLNHIIRWFDKYLK
jgi:dipeptidyl aminopeptidase/acylaminoacyl peptidase